MVGEPYWCGTVVYRRIKVAIASLRASLPGNTSNSLTRRPAAVNPCSTIRRRPVLVSARPNISKPAGHATDLAGPRQEELPVLVIVEHGFAAVALRHNMIEDPGVFDAQHTCHDPQAIAFPAFVNLSISAHRHSPPSRPLQTTQGVATGLRRAGTVASLVAQPGTGTSTGRSQSHWVEVSSAAGGNSSSQRASMWMVGPRK